MRYLTLAVLVFLVSAPAVLGCSCSAGDGGCSASSGTCPGGCYAICGAGGCSSGCAGRPQVNTPVFSFSGEGLQAPELQQRISEELGVQFVFAARKVDDHITVDLHDVSAADLMKGLSKVGAAALVHRDGAEAKAGEPLARRFSLKAENSPTEAVTRLLGQIFGEAATVKSADPKALMSIDLENVTLGDLRGVLAKTTGIRVDAASK